MLLNNEIGIMKLNLNFAIQICFVFILLTTNLYGSWLDKAKDMVDETGIITSSDSLTESEINSGLKEALHKSTKLVVEQLGTVGGFNADPDIHIPLPNSMSRVQTALDTIGMSDTLDDLEMRLNRAAEIATPKASDLFFNAISDMSLDDARGILEGPDDAATRYFKKKMTPDFVKEFTPIVDESLSESGAIKAYDQAISEYKSIPLVPDVKTDLSTYVVEEAMDGIFHYLAVEETKIRNDPAARTTDLLKKVFSN